jgi:tRNA(Ile)-lysidine synthase
LLSFNKEDLIYISKYVFGSFINDPSNEDDKFKRIKVRNFLKQLVLEGLDRSKFHLTIKNLKLANENIKFYVKKNLKKNVTILQKKENAILREDFFSQSEEVVFRSFVEVIKAVGKKYYPARGKKIDRIINLIGTKTSFKVTLGGCVIKKVNGTVILSKE